MATIKVKRGTDANRQLIIPAEGEPVFTTDTKKLYIGDGTTAGGIAVDTGGGSGGSDELTTIFLNIASLYIYDSVEQDDVIGISQYTIPVRQTKYTRICAYYDLAEANTLTLPDFIIYTSDVIDGIYARSDNLSSYQIGDVVEFTFNAVNYAFGMDLLKPINFLVNVFDPTYDEAASSVTPFNPVPLRATNFRFQDKTTDTNMLVIPRNDMLLNYSIRLIKKSASLWLVETK